MRNGRVDTAPEAAIALGASTPEAPTSNGADERKQWSVQEIQDILVRKDFGPQSPFLRVDVTDIKDKLAQFRDLEIPRNATAKRLKLPSVRANCSCTIWRRGGGTVVEQTRTCQIQSRTLPSGERWASVALESPFEVPISSLQADPNKPLPIGDMPSFSMELKLLAENLHDEWPPIDLKRVPGAKINHYYEGQDLVRLPLLIAKWPRLPDVPRAGRESLLDMKAFQTSPSDQSKWVEYTPKLGLVVDIDWYESPSLPLSASEEKYKRASLPRSLSPKPLEVIKGSTEWTFEGILESVPKRQFPAYHCPLCQIRHSGKSNSMRKFGSVDEFCFHLKNDHSALHWEYVPKFTLNSESAHVVQDGKIFVRPKREYEELARGTKGSEPRELDWMRPKEPLDIEAFLRGDESWLGRKKRSANIMPHMRYNEGVRSKGADSARTELIRRRPPEQIPDVPQRPRRKFRVPAAPAGVHFYRNATKRVLKEGEYLSESDDDIDKDWLLQKHADTIDSFTDTTKEEKEFIVRFDKHMLCEDLASDLHAAEALVRFCRQQRRWLRREDMRLELHKKMASLRIQGAISAKIIWACMAIVNEAAGKESAAEEEDELTSEKLLKINYGSDPIEKGHLYGRCAICQTMIRGSRRLIRCSNPTCSNPNYHLSCTQQPTRPPKWRCATCTSSRGKAHQPFRYQPPKLNPSSPLGTTDTAHAAQAPYSTFQPTPPSSSHTPPTAPPAFTTASVSALTSCSPPPPVLPVPAQVSQQQSPPLPPPEQQQHQLPPLPPLTSQQQEQQPQRPQQLHPSPKQQSTSMMQATQMQQLLEHQKFLMRVRATIDQRQPHNQSQPQQPYYPPHSYYQQQQQQLQHYQQLQALQQQVQRHRQQISPWTQHRVQRIGESSPHSQQPTGPYPYPHQSPNQSPRQPSMQSHPSPHAQHHSPLLAPAPAAMNGGRSPGGPPPPEASPF